MKYILTVLGVKIKMNQTFSPWCIAPIFPAPILHGLVVQGLEIRGDTLADIADDFTVRAPSARPVIVLRRGVLHRNA